MLRDLRHKALTLLSNVRVRLVTAGPAGLQATSVACVVVDQCIYITLPGTSDQLFNLEQREHECLLLGERWQLRGLGILLPNAQHPDYRGPEALAAQARRAGHVLAEIIPLRMQVESSTAYDETIDFDTALCGC